MEFLQVVLERSAAMTGARSAAPIAGQNARASGTDIVSYLSEGFGVNTFARESDTVTTPAPVARAAWSS